MVITDLINIVVVICGLYLAIKIHLHVKQGKLIPETWSGLFGIGAGSVMFVESMIRSVLENPSSEFVKQIIGNFIWSFAFGVVVYIGGRIIIRRIQDKK